MLTLSNLTCIRSGRTLFKHLGFTIGGRCLLVIKGANGSGKSSLLKIIATLLTPKYGKILYANEEVDGEYFTEYCDIINYIGHSIALKNNLSVRNNIIFWAKLYQMEAELVEPALRFFELNSIEDIKLDKLSMGWRKRVQLAKLLLRRSDIWLLDEPYTYLDKRGRFLLDGLIRSRIDQGGSVIIASNEDITLEGACYLQIEDFS